jgi:hypothetical protein
LDAVTVDAGSRLESVVAHYVDGRIVKGYTSDFSPDRPSFTITTLDAGGRLEISFQNLKAVFFVKDFHGDAEFSEWKQFVEPRLGLKVALKFQDGEVMVGARLPISTSHGFFLFPADHASNNEKIFVVNAAVKVIEQLPE